MKITFLITGFTDGGAQKQCLYLIEELSKIKGIEIQLLYFLDGVNSNSLNFVNVSMKKIETSKLFLLIITILTIFIVGFSTY